jgi:hypothetical protein
VAVVAVEVESKRTNPVLRALDSVPAKWWLGIIAAIVLGASAVFGGLDDATVASPEPRLLAAGDTFTAPELSTTVHSARITDLAPGYSLEPDVGNTYLVVTATVMNNWTTSTTSIGDLLQLEWLETETHGEADRTALVSDGSPLPQANPGVPTDVAYIWQVPVDELSPGDIVRVSIRSKTLTVDGDVTYGSYWSSPIVAARVDVEITG